MDRFGLGILTSLNRSLKRTHPAKMLFQFLLGMPIRFIHGFSRFS
jgi:hypothetical protein